MTKISHKQLQKFVAPYKVTAGKKFRLDRFDPGDTGGFKSEFKSESKDLLAKGIEWLADAQDKLYAQDQWSVLLVFQAMDAAGKDGTIKHVMSGVNPQGVQVVPFKVPSKEELDHDYLWRCVKALPERGRIGIFNRSYYEEVLVVRVHPEYLAGQQLPRSRLRGNIWKRRFEEIAGFERHLSNNGYLVLKFFLHVSEAEQKKRFLERLDQPNKNWKFSAADVKERQFFGDYMKAYEDAIRHTAAPHAPWYVVPADNKWFTRLVVAGAIVDAMSTLDLHYPKLGAQQRAELEKSRRLLEAE